jgi:hypothetical protein
MNPDDYYYAYDIYATKISLGGLPVLDTAVKVDTDHKDWPSIAFDGTNFVIAWEEHPESEFKLAAAVHDTAGRTVTGPYGIASQTGAQLSPNLCHGPGSQVLLTYSGWAPTVNCKTYNTMRIWGELCDFEGIEEQKPERQAARAALDIAQNPFRSSATINFTLSKSGTVSIRIYDAGGRLVRRLAEGRAALGSHTLSWDGRDDRRNLLPGGLYFCTLRSTDGVLAKKLVKLE